MKNFTKLIPVLIYFLSSAFFGVFGQTNVSGGIYTNTTWTFANSPFIVVDTVVVFPGVTLTIEPGATVKFADNKVIEIRQAKIIANGTSVDSITFTSNSPSPVPGIYSGIYLNGGNLTSTFNYCNVNYANIGINVDVLDSVVVNNSNFNQNYIGLQFAGYTGSAKVAKIDSSIFDNSTYGLVLASLFHATISYCNFSHDSIEGFYLYDASEHFSSTTSYCNFSNDGIGLYMDMYYSTINQCNFSGNSCGLKGAGFQSCCAAWFNKMNNCIFNFNQTGINNLDHVVIDSCTISRNQTGYSSSYGNGILNSTVDSNSVIGISDGGDSIINCNVKYNGTGIRAQGCKIYGNNIEYNTFKNIEGYGVMSQNIIRYSNFGIDDSIGPNGVSLTGNTIEFNNVGIRINYSSTITCNSICNNTTYDLQYGAIANIDVSHNYWCNPDSASLEALIYDGYDNINYGLVSFLPFDSLCSPVTTTVINEIANENLHIGIFPNPFTKNLFVKVNDNDQLQITLYDILSGKLLQQSFTNSTILNTEKLASGIYIYEVSNKNGLVGKGKIVKQ